MTRDATVAQVRRRGVLTPGDVARLLGVSPATVARWCTSGLLPSYTVPGSAHRRIAVATFRQFVAERIGGEHAAVILREIGGEDRP